MAFQSLRPLGKAHATSFSAGKVAGNSAWVDIVIDNGFWMLILRKRTKISPTYLLSIVNPVPVEPVPVSVPALHPLLLSRSAARQLREYGNYTD